MDTSSFPVFVPLLFAPFMLLNLVWYVAVIVFLYKIWNKVKALPG